jgi:hypothetical protein
MINHYDSRSQFEGKRLKTPICSGRNFTAALAVLAGISLAATSATAQAKLPGGLDSPDQGVVCNAQRASCYDRRGPSIGLTEEFLGHLAAERLTSILHNSETSASRQPTFSPADGVECVRETGPCRIQRQSDAALTAVLYRPRSRPAGQKTAEIRAIMYGQWHWQRSRYSNETEARPSHPERYILRFEPDGILSAKVDCNSASGNYRFEGNQVTLQLTNST